MAGQDQGQTQGGTPEPGATQGRPASRSPRGRFAPVLVVLLVVAALLAIVAWNWPASDDNEYSLVNEGTLTVASSLDCPPYATLEDGSPAGYDIAVIQEVANRLGLSCSVEQVSADTVSQAVGEGDRFDVGASSLSPSRDGADGVSFTESYCLVDQAVVVTSSSYGSADDLSGRVVAAPEDSASLACAESLTDRALSCLSVEDCFTLLERGSVSGLVVDLPVANALLGGHDACRIVERVATNDARAIAVNADNEGLTQAINDALHAMEDDGTLAALQAQYL